MSPDWASHPMAVPYAQIANPQSLNLYSYLLNNPLAGVDADGHCGQQQQGGTCPNVTVKVNAPPTVQTNVPVNGQKVSGVGTTTTIKLTNANGTPAAGVPIKASPSTKTTITLDGQTSTRTSSNTQANPAPVTTSAQGTIGDIVMQPITNKPVGPNQAITAQDGAGAQNEVPLTQVTTQNLSFPGQGCNCSATYSETFTNVGSEVQWNGKPG
jgi:hypothetical protein